MAVGLPEQESLSTNCTVEIRPQLAPNNQFHGFTQRSGAVTGALCSAFVQLCPKAGPCSLFALVCLLAWHTQHLLGPMLHLAGCREESEGKKAERSSSNAAERDAHAARVYTNTRSERMVEELKARRFRQIFAYLDQVRSKPFTPSPSRVE